MVNTSQQIGGAIGTTPLNTIATGATTTYAHRHPASPAAGDLPFDAFVHGYSTAIRWTAGILVLAALAATVLVRHDPRHPATGTAAEAQGASQPALAGTN
ncbi:hypothetical protein NX801_20570 [Streptomyces sp. LP05-1]|uniref:Uncharacterized protein n=1 Tax=Streptomyces pyxinae TaxID=2970734 RepID=A0ABT2CKQ8_9ACTN|nr:hypothetical protein [Streptomyces sp. LP05-1]MCS0638006.1 hypothetical protein [Streptomyces sp. LP05-1]